MSLCRLRDTSFVWFPNKAFPISQTPELHRQFAGPVDMETPSSLTPADLPLDECDLRPRRIIRSLHLLKTKAGREGISKHVALTPVYPSGQRLAGPRRAAGQPLLNM